MSWLMSVVGVVLGECWCSVRVCFVVVVRVCC